MNMREEFERMMREQCEIALATMTDGLPHVRIVNFYYTSEERHVYFATLKDNEKVVELAANPNIASAPCRTTIRWSTSVQAGTRSNPPARSTTSPTPLRRNASACASSSAPSATTLSSTRSC